jgi:hypothetical protein
MERNQNEVNEMNYTIASMSDTRGDMSIDFDRNGNMYMICLRNTETNELTYKEFTNHADAVELFSKLSMAILTGCYSYEDRKAMFN